MLTTCIIIIVLMNVLEVKSNDGEIDIIDLTKPAIWKNLVNYYTSIEKNWKICRNCGSPKLGTAMHLGHAEGVRSIRPAIIPPEYLLTRLIVVDATSFADKNPNFVLTLDLALTWTVLQHDPGEPTLLLFKFGWKEDDNMRSKNCVCRIPDKNSPGLSYGVAEYISLNMSHVVGVATDAPTLESDETREFTLRTVSALLGKNGVYMIENVHIKRLPELGCLTLAMPLKLLNANYVPTRLTAFCPMAKNSMHVDISLKPADKIMPERRDLYINLEELLEKNSSLNHARYKRDSWERK